MKKINQKPIVTFALTSFLWFFAPQAQSDPVLEQIRDATQATANYTNSVLTSLQTTGKQILDALTAPTPAIDDTTKGNTQIASAC